MNVNTDFKPVPTRAALALQKKNKPSEFQAMVFEEPKFSAPVNKSAALAEQRKRRNPNASDDNESNVRKPVKDDLEFDIKRARNEVLKFAMNNQRVVKNKKKMEVFQAIKLGAKPAKKPYKNYKELKDERQRLQQIREERKKFHQLGKNQTGAASIKCRSKSKIERQQKKRAPVSRIDQHYGVSKPKLKRSK